MNAKLSRNTDLRLALGQNQSREQWEQFHNRNPTWRVGSVSWAVRQHTPLRSRHQFGADGFSGFQLTADERSYTVVVLADDPVEWTLLGIHSFRTFTQSMLDPMAVRHLIDLADRAAMKTRVGSFDPLI